MAGPGQIQWTRETSWRQGHVLAAAAAQSLGLVRPDDTSGCVVVISHDCDLANADLDVEPSLEVVVGRVVPTANGNFTWGKAPRTLHYTVQRDGAPAVIELVNTRKWLVAKADLAKYSPDPDFVLDGRGLAVLRSWLGSRYNRAAFPDAFVNRMKSTKVDTKLAKGLETSGDLISFVYFDLDGGATFERREGDPYTLSIVLVFSPGDDADTAADDAEELAGTIEAAVRERLKHSRDIVLKSCFAISEDDLTVSRARVLSQWRLEYMTLRAESEQLGPPLV